MYGEFKQYISSDVESFLFGSEEDAKKLFRNVYKYPMIAYNVCLFYATAFQAYVFAKAFHFGTSLGEKQEKIKEQWLDDKNRKSLQGSGVFSFLSECIKMDDIAFGENAKESLQNARDIWLEAI